MKKNKIKTVKITELLYGGESSGYYEENAVNMKRGIPGQTVSIVLKGKKGKILSLISPSEIETEPVCEKFGKCGGCTYLSVPYELQLELKLNALKKMFAEYGHAEFNDIKIIPSPEQYFYKNKMEFTFGNEQKDFPLNLGLHQVNFRNSIISVNDCMLIDEDYKNILKASEKYFISSKLPFYHIMKRTGYLRHLVIRKGKNTGEILINLISTSQDNPDLSEWIKILLNLKLKGRISGILHTTNDSFSDVVQADELKILYGKNIFSDDVLGMKFEISPFSFFQTNTHGAEILYSKVIEFTKTALANQKHKTVFDLYSGTGTIGILLASVCDKIISVEIVEEAVEIAKKNASLNNVENITFICEDVSTALSKLDEKPYLIILDPPRNGLSEKALRDTISLNAEKIIYVSCNPKTFAEELIFFKQAGYEATDTVAVDQFPNTYHVECIALIQRVKS